MSVKCILTEQGGKGGGTGKVTLQSIEITTAPTKAVYNSGDHFDPTGLVLKAVYGQNGVEMGSKTVNAGDEGLSYSPDPLTDGTTQVTISYTDGGATATIKTPVTVNAVLRSIRVATAPTKTSYKYGDALDLTGMVIENVMSDGTSSATSNYTTAPANGNTLSTLGSVSITVTSTENSSFTATTTITVDKADGAINSYTPASPTINMSNYSTGLTVSVSHAGTGTLTNVTSSDPSIVRVDSFSGDSFVLKGDGSTAGSVTITLTVSGDTNYEAVTDSLTVTAAYWSWGNDGDDVDEDWFKGLANYLYNNTNSAIASMVTLGETRYVTLSPEVLGATRHKIMVIGVNQDADKTITWQTRNDLPTRLTFATVSSRDSSKDDYYSQWQNSKARQECQNYYNAFPGKAYIMTVKKGTCLTRSTGSSRNDDVTYSDETVFVPSEREMGLDSYSPLSVANSSTSKAECTQGKNFAYAWYTTNARRIKYEGDANEKTDGSNGKWYWERSRLYADATDVCHVGDDGSASSGTCYNTGGSLAPDQMELSRCELRRVSAASEQHLK